MSAEQHGTSAGATGVTAAWLSDDVLVLVVDPAPDTSLGAGCPAVTAGRRPLDARRLDESVLGTDSEAVLVTVDVRPCRGQTRQLEIGSPSGRVEARLYLDHDPVPLNVLARRHLAGLDPGRRAGALSFLCSSARAHGAAFTTELATGLHLLRECLRERRPLVTGAAGRARLEVDTVLCAGERSFWVTGRYAGPGLVELTAVSPEGSRTQLLDDLVWATPGDDQTKVAEPSPRAFSCSVTMEEASALRAGWVLEARSVLGDLLEVAGPAVTNHVAEVAEALLGGPSERWPHPLIPGERERRTRFVTRAMQARAGRARVVAHRRFGPVRTSPEVSLIVAVGQRLEAVEHQLAQFCDDPDLATTEVMYVVDGPEQAGPLEEVVRGLHELYGLAIDLVDTEGADLRALAANLAAARAAGRLLVLLHPDVLPEGRGWIRALSTFHDSRPRMGALGPTLVYEDDSIHHTGVDVAQHDGGQAFLEPLKGLHRGLAEGPPRRTAAVGGGCLMVAKETYHEVGGLRPTLPDDENAELDLCARLTEAGRDNWYLPDVVLYFLEDRSLDREARSRPVRAWVAGGDGTAGRRMEER